MPKMWPRGRVSLGPVTSSTVCLVAAGLGLTPLSIDFALYLETVFPSSHRRVKMGRVACEALLDTAVPGSLGELLGQCLPKGITLFPAPEQQ